MRLYFYSSWLLTTINGSHDVCINCKHFIMKLIIWDQINEIVITAVDVRYCNVIDFPIGKSIAFFNWKINKIYSNSFN